MKKLILFFSLIFSLAHAADIYVSSSGSDNASGTKSAPFKTINAAVAKSAPGDTVFVLPGSYAPAKFTKNGTSAKWITIKSTVKWGAKIETSGNVYCFTVQNSSYIAVDGFEFTQQGAIANRSATGYGFLQTDGHHITVKNCHAHHCGGNGIAMAYGDYFTAENNVSHHNAYWDPAQTSGISVYIPKASDNLPGFHIVIRNNIIYSNENKVPTASGSYTDGNGIIMDAFDGSQGGTKYGPESLVEGNIVYDNGRKGIHIFSSQNVTIRKNTCYWNNKAVRDNFNYSPELSNNESLNSKFRKNIAVANPAYPVLSNGSGTPNVAIGDVCYSSNCNAGSEWTENITWNGKQGDKSTLQINRVADMSTNLLGVDPQFVGGNFNAIKPENVSGPSFVEVVRAFFSLKPGSPATGKGAVGGTVVVPPDPEPDPDPKPEPVECDTVYKTIYVDVPGPVVFKTDTIYVVKQADPAELVGAIEGKLAEIVAKNKITISLTAKQRTELLSAIQAYIAKLND